MSTKKQPVLMGQLLLPTWLMIFSFFPIVVISIVGSTIHFLLAYNVGKKHNEHLTAQTKRLQDQLDEEERLRNEQHEREKDQGNVHALKNCYV